MAGLEKPGAFSNLDILFIVPPLWRIMGKKWDAYPLGLGYLVSSLSQINVKSAIYHANYLEKDLESQSEYVFSFLSKKWDKYYAAVQNEDHEIWKEVLNVIRITNPKIVGISSTIVDLPSTFMIARLIKEQNREITIIIGGPSATTYSQKIIEQPFIDFLVIGEGEKTISELVPAILNQNFENPEIPGIMYRKNGHVIITKSRELIKDLDPIPFPDRESIFFLNGNEQIDKIYLTTDILLSRGCPFRCKFCSCFTIWGNRKPRSRSNDNILAEINFLKTRYGQNNFIFWDDLFTINRKKVADLCTKIIENDLKIQWVCLARIDTVDGELLSLMKKAGCTEVQFGIESGTDRILSFIDKGITISQINEKARIIRKSGIPWRIFLIIGFPTETEAEILTTIKYIDLLQPDSVDLSIFSPYPGTPLYADLEAAGKIDEKALKNDPSYLENNFTSVIADAQFKKIAKFAFDYVTRYNQRSNNPFYRIRKHIQNFFPPK